jgi:NAD(P)-dependent dehydrogenase (short-subunit alcohol dehydrogenase family)
MARALAREWGPEGVRVNCVAPLAATPAMEEAFERDPAMAARVLGRNPLGRLGDAADDVGPVVRFLLSDDARYVNGMTVMADGASCPIT